MKVTTITKFRRHLKEYFDQVAEGTDVLVVTRNNDEPVVLMTMEKYNQKVEEDELLGARAYRKLLEATMAAKIRKTLQDN